MGEEPYPPPPLVEVKVGRGNIYSQGIYSFALIPTFSVFSHTHTKKPVSLVGGVGSGDSSSTRELISVSRVFTFPFQEGLAGSPEGHG